LERLASEVAKRNRTIVCKSAPPPNLNKRLLFVQITQQISDLPFEPGVEHLGEAVLDGTGSLGNSLADFQSEIGATVQ